MTADEIKKLITEAEQDPKRLAAAVSGVSETVLQRRPAPGKWSIHEIVGHLADAEVIFAYRFRQVLADKDRKFAPIDQDAWTQHLGYTEAAIPELIAQFRSEEHTSELQSLRHLVCRLLLEKKKI